MGFSRQEYWSELPFPFPGELHDLLQHLPSYLGFSYLGRWVSLHGCSSKVQPMLLTLDEGYLLTAALPDHQLDAREFE